MDEHLKRMKKEHLQGKHFPWTNCPWCWAIEQIKREFQSEPTS